MDDQKRNFNRNFQMIKSEIINITTPVCLFQFAWLVEPDTKFDASGIWQVECLIHPDDATEVEEQLSGLLERWKAQLKSANPNKKFKLASLPWEFTDVDGKPYFKVKTKMKGGGIRADGTQWKQRPPVLFNADGSPMTEEQKEKVNKCGPGTTGQVNMRCSGWETAAFGVGIRQARTVDIGKIMKTCGYDWLFIDLEHNSMDIDMATQISMAAQDTGITPIVRVPDFAHHHATRVLDCGSQGIVFPHVDDKETAERLVSNCLFPPKGHRSMTGLLPQLDFKKYPVGEVSKIINDDIIIVVMLETPKAIFNVEEIASVPGIDVLLVGTNDLCMEMGIPGEFNHNDVKEAYKKVIQACNNNNILPGMGGVYDCLLYTSPSPRDS